jgi:hypothetical protein
MTDNPPPIPMRSTLLDKEPLTPGCCEWCGAECESGDFACSLSCEAMLHRLEATQGRMVIRALKRWRMKPNHAARNEAISHIVPMTDRFLRNDRKRRETLAAERRAAAAAKTEDSGGTET